MNGCWAGIGCLLLAGFGCGARTAARAPAGAPTAPAASEAPGASPPAEPALAPTVPRPSLTTAAATPESCSGRVSDPLLRALTARAAEARHCYEELLRTTPQAAGRLVVQLDLSPMGLVTSASVVEDEVGETELRSCVLALFESSPLPAPEGGCAIVKVPLRFESKPPPPDAEPQN